ncbi:MAG: hypothetical protein ACLP7J_23660 [Streptosporangiaceae bacterium]
MNKHFTRALGAVAAGVALTASGLAASGAAGADQVRPSSPAVFGGRLYGVAATSARNAWAVGLTGARTLIVHWNGRAWTKAPASTGFLEGVAAVSATSAWAVGGTD